MINTINNYLKEHSKESEINFLQAVTLLDSKKLSITCKYLKNYKYYYLEYDSNNNTFNKVEAANPDNYYYGLHPRINENIILNAIKEKAYLTKEKFLEFANKHISNFMLDIDSKELLISLFYKTLLQSASNFGFPIKISSEDKELFIAKTKGKLLKNVDYKFVEKDNDHLLFILGSITLDKIKTLNNLKFGYKIDDDKLVFTKDDGSSFLKLFNNQLDKLKTTGLFYYSGVLPRLKRIEEKKHKSSNDSIDLLILHFERTTYFTVNMMDYSYINDHKYLEDYSKVLLDFENKEDKLLNDTLFSDKQLTINLVNEYLEKSTGTNIIAVTGNIFTKDNYYTLTQRSKRSIDAEEMYPSVNGQSEIYDFNVEFYNESVYEDLPTLLAEERTRLDYNKELDRESYAELHIKSFVDEWEYYGLSVLGIDRRSKEDQKQRRLHFNVLAKNKTSMSVLELASDLNKATEREENNNIYAIKINIFSSWFKYFLNYLLNIGKLIIDWKSLLLTPFSVLLTIFNIYKVFKSDSPVISLENLNSLINLFVLIIVIIVSVVDLIKSIKEYQNSKKMKKNITVVKKDTLITKTDLIIEKIKLQIEKQTKSKIIFHPITKLMIFMLHDDVK